jgi:hypothetical protein
VKRTCIGLATALAYAVFGTVTALAQPASPAVAPKVEIGSDTKYVAVVLAGDIQEEVEILRRLLANGLADAYGFPSHKTLTPYRGVRYYPLIGPAQITESSMGDNSTNGMAGSFVPADQPAPHPEGVYLKDYGVVYTATLPSPPSNPLSGTTVGAVTRTPLSPWERARKELRGETIEPEGKSVNGLPPLAEVILKVLAENGKHFTRLAEGERITVAVTFRDDAANGIYHPPLPGMVPSQYRSASGSTGSPPAFGPGLPPGNGLPGGPRPSPNGSVPGGGFPPPGYSIAPGAPEDDAAWLTDVRNAIRLGDLHLQRGKGQDAITAYKEALDRLEKEMFSRKNAPGKTPGGEDADAGDVPVLLMEVELCYKIAQVYVQTGDFESGRAMIQRASKLAKQAETLTGATAEANPRPTQSALPSKLIVTASKKLLDEVGSGKLTFEAFRKAATVEYVTPSAADKK